MKVSDKLVRELQKRVDTTYEEAEKALHRCDNDIDAAERYLRDREESRMNRLQDEIGRIYRELLTYYVKILRKEKTVLDIPLAVVVLFFLLLTSDSKIWMSVIVIGIILISESTVSLYRLEKDQDPIVDESNSKEEEFERTSTFEEAKAHPDRAADMNGSSEVSEVTKSKDDDDDYYEITIEK